LFIVFFSKFLVHIIHSNVTVKYVNIYVSTGTEIVKIAHTMTEL